MPDVNDDYFAVQRRKRDARIAGYPLWLHARAHGVLSILSAGVAGAGLFVLVGKEPVSKAAEFVAVWACSAVLIYAGSLAWNSISGRRRKAAGHITGA